MKYEACEKYRNFNVELFKSVSYIKPLTLNNSPFLRRGLSPRRLMNDSFDLVSVACTSLEISVTTGLLTFVRNACVSYTDSVI